MNNITVSLLPATLRKIEHEAARRGLSVDELIDTWLTNRHQNRQGVAVMLGKRGDP